MGLTAGCWGYRVHRDGSDSFGFACPSLHSPRFSLSILLLSLSLSLALSLSHAVSKQTVLSRSIYGCLAVEEEKYD